MTHAGAASRPAAAQGPATDDLPATLAGFRDRPAGAPIVVCGCGSSLRELASPERLITIGVNDVGRLFDPTYLVVVNHRHQFSGDRFRYVERSRARAVFSHLSLGIQHPHQVRIRLGRYGGTDLSDPSTLHYTRNSPYVALCLAVLMGARRIGLIGVDFTEHHFFARTGRHALSRDLDRIDREYRALGKALEGRGVEVINLSRESRLTAFPKGRPEDLTTDRSADRAHGALGRSLRILSYATTPVAGVPAILARCIAARTGHQAECVWARGDYGNGVCYPGGVQWRREPAKARELLAGADAVIVHNGKVAAEHRGILAGKPVITMAHNYLRNVDQGYVRKGHPGVVVAQYQATLPELKSWTPLPNPVPLWERDYGAAPKHSDVTICYTPSGKRERYPKGHRLYWHGKGYRTTVRVLERLAGRYPLRLELVRERQLPHERVLAMKQRSHIVIDECVTGSYHRNSLEGLAMGCVVVNGIGLLPGVAELFRHCSGSGGDPPFVPATLENLEAVLAGLIELGAEELARRGELNRRWMASHWAFEDQWRRFWEPVVARAIAVAGTPRIVARGAGRGPAETPSAGRIPEDARGPVAAPPALAQGEAGPPPEARSCSGEGAGSGRTPRRQSGAGGVRAYWTCRGSVRGNFGDMLTPVLVEALAGRPAVFAPRGPRLFAVGSLLKLAMPGDRVWGSGFIDAEDSCRRGIDVRAVRGPLTRRKLLALGIDCPEVYGDPGLLLPALRALPPADARGIAVIPHYADLAAVRAQVRDPAVGVIDIRAGVDEVLRQVARYQVLLSSSLHGCILGDAYGKPTAWVRVSDKVVGNGFKFLDYYASTGRDPVVSDWREGVRLDEAVELALQAPPPALDLQPLVESFPDPDPSRQRLKGLPLQTPGGRMRDPGPGPRRAVTPEILPAGSAARLAGREGRTAADARRASDTDAPRLAVFSAGDERYARSMVTSLRSFMACNPGRQAEPGRRARPLPDQEDCPPAIGNPPAKAARRAARPYRAGSAVRGQRAPPLQRQQRRLGKRHPEHRPACRRGAPILRGARPPHPRAPLEPGLRLPGGLRRPRVVDAEVFPPLGAGAVSPGDHPPRSRSQAPFPTLLPTARRVGDRRVAGGRRGDHSTAPEL